MLRFRPTTSKPKCDLYCVGAINIDRIITFSQPPAMGRDTDATSIDALGGVACNLAQLLNKFGQPVALAGFIGNDLGGQFAQTTLSKLSIDSTALTKVASANTCTYTAFHKPDGELYVASFEGAIYAKLTPESFEHIVDRIQYAKDWIFDTCYPSIAYERFASAARFYRANVYIVISSVNNIEAILPMLRVAKMLFGNVAEITHLAGVTDQSAEGIKIALRAVSRLGPKTICATHGEHGIYLYADDDCTYMPAVPITRVVSVNGAGDSLAAAALHTLLNGGDLGQAMRNGLLAASQRVSGQEIILEPVKAATPIDLTLTV